MKKSSVFILGITTFFLSIAIFCMPKNINAYAPNGPALTPVPQETFVSNGSTSIPALMETAVPNSTTLTPAPQETTAANGSTLTAASVNQVAVPALSFGMLYDEYGVVDIKDSATPSQMTSYEEPGIQWFTGLLGDFQGGLDVYGIFIDASLLKDTAESHVVWEDDVISFGGKIILRYFPENPTFGIGDNMKVRCTASLQAGCGWWNVMPNVANPIVTATAGCLFSLGTNKPTGILFEAFATYLNFSRQQFPVADETFGIGLGFLFPTY